MSTRAATRGNQYFFSKRSYHFQALRALQLAPLGAADANEVLLAVGQTIEGDMDSWYHAWLTMARTIEQKSRSYQDDADRALALHRSSNYYRTAEFFLHADDPRRRETWAKHVDHFELALDITGVRREHLRIPYEDKQLNAVFYPATDPPNFDLPLIVGFNGWDGTITELYYALAVPGTRRGYNVLLYEGPGQGAVLRDQGLRFTHEWHRPNSAVLDHFITLHRRPSKLILFGTSLGAILVMRAAASDPRIDGVVASGVMFDALEVSLHKLPKIARWLYERGHRNILNWIIRRAAKTDAVVGWGLNHARWTMGIQDEVDSLDSMSKYQVRDALGTVAGDVLLMQGECDHFEILSDQMGQTKRGLIRARSVTEVTFKRGEGGEEHCQIGAMLQHQATLFQWLDAKFKASGKS